MAVPGPLPSCLMKELWTDCTIAEQGTEWKEFHKWKVKAALAVEFSSQL